MSSGSEPAEIFRCEVVRDAEGARVRAIGELDLDAVPHLAAEMARLRQEGCRHVVVDLRELTFLDSSGLRCILECYAESRRDGLTMALIPGPQAVQRVFELTHTAELLPFIAP